MSSAALPPLDAQPFLLDGSAAPLPEVAGPRDPDALSPQSQWRYASSLPFPASVRPVSLGEGFVTLEPLKIPGLPAGAMALRDDLNPTGSWKDRGSSTLVTMLAHAGVTAIIEDSSGNAALSLAAYARRAGIAMKAFVPSAASPAKKALIAEEGAVLVEIPGPRENATAAAREEASRGAFWAAHAAQPWHALGATSGAFNIVEALREMPRTVVLPCGQGGYLCALYRGFQALAAAGRGVMPALVGVQSARCAPIARAFASGATSVDAIPGQTGLAEGVLSPAPSRGAEVLRAVRSTQGLVATVDDLALDRALRLLWLGGFKVEPTSALPVAWLLQECATRSLASLEGVVVVLTGHGIRRGRPLWTSA